MTPEAASLIERARDADNPKPEDCARVRLALASTLGAEVLTSVASSAASTGLVRNAAPAGDASAVQQAAATGLQSAAASVGSGVTAGALPAAGAGAAGLGKLAAWAGIGFLAGATTIGGAKLVGDLAEPTGDQPRVAANERSAESEKRPAAADLAPKVDPAPASSAVAPVFPAKNVEQGRQERIGHPNTKGVPVVATRASGTQLEAELSLIEQAQGALRDGDPRRALTLLGEHERRFPSGLLLEERLASRTLALCRLGLKAEAEQVAQVLTRHSPQSALWPSVALACGFEK